MEAFRPPTPQSAKSSVTPSLLPSQFLIDQSSLQRRFQMLLEGVREKWMYVIYWQCSSHNHSSAASLLSWGDGYYTGNGKAQKATSPAVQAHRKNIFRTLNSLISGPSPTDDDCDEDVTDPEWFFLVSMTETFVNGTGVLGQAFFNSNPVWVTGSDRLSEVVCQRARRFPEIGLQTMVCIPCPNGVVELASTEVVLPNSDLIIKVRDLFNFNHPVADLPSSDIMQPRENKVLHERASIEMQNHENNKFSKQSRGKEKMRDSKCSWFLLSESSDEGSDSTYSHSYDYSGPS